MRIGRWSELGVDRVCQEHEVMREADANERSGELGSALGGTLVRVSLLRIPWPDPLIESAILPPPLVSVDPEYQTRWCALKSPRIMLSGVVRRCYIEDLYQLLEELAGGRLMLEMINFVFSISACMARFSRCGSYSDSADDSCLEKVTDPWMKISEPPPSQADDPYELWCNCRCSFFWILV